MSQNNHSGHNSDYDLLEAIERRTRAGEPAGDPVLDELAGLRPIARREHTSALEDSLIKQAHHQKRLTERNQPMQATYPNSTATPALQPNKRKAIPLRKRIPATLVAVLTTAVLAVTSMFALNQQPGGEHGMGVPAQNETSTATMTPTSTITSSPTFTPIERSTPLVVTATPVIWESTQEPAYSTMVLPFTHVQMSDSIVQEPLQVDEKINIFALIPVEREATTSNDDTVTIADTLTPSVTRNDDARVLRVNTTTARGIESLVISISDADKPILEWLIDAGVTLIIQRAED